MTKVFVVTPGQGPDFLNDPGPHYCECEHTAHTDGGHTPKGALGHAYGYPFPSLVTVHTGYGIRHVCPACAMDCLAEYVAGKPYVAPPPADTATDEVPAQEALELEVDLPELEVDLPPVPVVVGGLARAPRTQKANGLRFLAMQQANLWRTPDAFLIENERQI